MMITTLTSARNWLGNGIAPIPVLARDKRPARPWLEYQHTLPTLQDLQAWFRDGQLNLGVVTGWRGLAVLDFDSRGGYNRWLWYAVRARVMNAITRDTYRVRTARGMHVYARLVQPVKSRPIRPLGIDVKGLGGYVVAPPSIHPSGAVYTPEGTGVLALLSGATLGDLLPVAELVRAAVEDPDPDSPIRIVLPDLATVASADPWDAAARVVEFDRARGLARIKNTFRIEDWFPDRTRSSSDGRWWLARCPWHDDQNPSFWIDTTRQLCGCHAGCTPHPLDVIDVFARTCSLSNEEAIRILSRAAGS
jgi:hypothetical protein